MGNLQSKCSAFLHSFVLLQASCFLLLSCPGPAQASGNTDLSIEVKAGGGYNSNVLVTEIDRTLNQGNAFAQLSAEIDLRHDFDQNSTLRTRYRYSHTLNEEFTDFDAATHLAAVSFHHDLDDRLRLGITTSFADSNLGGFGFLRQGQISPNLWVKFSQENRLRLAYRYAHKKFETVPDRTADVHAGSADYYHFLDGSREYLSAGYAYEHNNARNEEFTYDGHKLRARYVRRLGFGWKAPRMEVGYRFEARDYRGDNPFILEPRKDRRHRLQARLKIPLTRSLSAEVIGEQLFANSNLRLVDYERSLGLFRLSFEF